jgi:hypothetical protein
MRTSEQIDKIAEALSKAQGEFINPEKNKVAKIPTKAGGSYSYAYADLPEIFNSTRKALCSNQLSHTTGLRYAPSIVLLIGRLMHSSGQWIESEYEISRNTDPKILAASMTYGRRYVITALLGIAADEDTDEAPEGEYDDKDKKPIPPKTNPANSPVKPIGSSIEPKFNIQDAWKKIHELRNKLNMNMNDLTVLMKANIFKELPEYKKEDFDLIIHLLNNNILIDSESIPVSPKDSFENFNEGNI